MISLAQSSARRVIKITLIRFTIRFVKINTDVIIYVILAHHYSDLLREMRLCCLNMLQLRS